MNPVKRCLSVVFLSLLAVVLNGTLVVLWLGRNGIAEKPTAWVRALAEHFSGGSEPAVNEWEATQREPESADSGGLAAVDSAESPASGGADGLAQTGVFSGGVGAIRSGEEDAADEGARLEKVRQRQSMLRPPDIEKLLKAIHDRYQLSEYDGSAEKLEVLRRAAESGGADALLDLGLFLAYGTTDGGDPALAADFFRRAAEGGSRRALAELGRLHLSGLGVELDPEIAAAYFQESAAAGEAEGAFLLAMMHRLELFSGSKPELALEWFTRAADAGHNPARVAAFDLHIGNSLDFGDKRRTLMWLMRAAEEGDPGAILRSGRFFEWIGLMDEAQSAFEAAGETGSFAALKELIKLRGGLLNESNAKQWLPLLEAHASADGEVASNVLFMAAMAREIANRGQEDPVMEGYLNAAVESHNPHASVVQGLRESGVPIEEAFRQAYALDDTAAYRKMLEIKERKRGANLRDRNPQILHNPNPVYPVELLADGREGYAKIRFVVDHQGMVRETYVAEASHPAFAVAAIDAIQKWKFLPARKGGVDVNARMELRFDFKQPN